mmetsp:Transcript_114777/g.202587  ORF Transcript_114777/g.202587 Transcript_114777/m.202587 type:complete len:396 (+) Transcript_114777:85-1272(+)
MMIYSSVTPLLLLNAAIAVHYPVLQRSIAIKPTATFHSYKSVHSEVQSKTARDHQNKSTKDKLQPGEPSKGDFPVDVVYTWLAEPRKGSETWAEIKKSCGTVDMQRYRDHGTLHASLLALETFLPWVHKVFIVTAGEVPCGIEHFSMPIEMVSHRQIFPKERQKTDLPTHNPMAIETHLHRISGLAEHFLFFDDDMFIGRPLGKSFFFTDDGKPIYYTMNITGDRLLQSVETHSPLIDQCSATAQFDSKRQANPFRKSAIVELQGNHWAFFEAISRQRCRAPGSSGSNLDNDPFGLYMCYHEHHGYAVLNKSTASVALLRDTRDINVKHARDWYSKVLSLRPSKFCINNDFKVARVDLRHEEEALAEFLCRYLMSMHNFEKITKACPSHNSCSRF